MNILLEVCELDKYKRALNYILNKELDCIKEDVRIIDEQDIGSVYTDEVSKHVDSVIKKDTKVLLVIGGERFLDDIKERLLSELVGMRQHNIIVVTSSSRVVATMSDIMCTMDMYYSLAVSETEKGHRINNLSEMYKADYRKLRSEVITLEDTGTNRFLKTVVHKTISRLDLNAKMMMDDLIGISSPKDGVLMTISVYLGSVYMYVRSSLLGDEGLEGHRAMYPQAEFSDITDGWLTIGIIGENLSVFIDILRDLVRPYNNRGVDSR